MKKKYLFSLLATFAILTMLAPVPGVSALQVAQTPLPGSAIPQFVDPLPDLLVLDGTTGAQIQLEMKEFKSMVLPASTPLPGGVPYAGTWVWGYRVPSQSDSTHPYIGPIILAKRGTPTEVKFINNLGNSSTTNVTAYKNSTDQTLHWADPLNDGANMGAHMEVPGQLPVSPYNQNYAGPIPAAVHLHGGEVPPVLDGGPDSWFTSDGNYVGHAFYSRDSSTPKNYAIYRYPNVQQAAPLWFHDHTLGATRLNVYAGLAGAYLLIDPNNPNNPDPTNLNFPAPKSLPGPADIIPLVLQDRMFDTNGQLFFPSDTLGGMQYSPNPEHPYWVPEFVGDTVVVNGKAWPYKVVDPKRYRFLVLNGSNARTYELNLPGAPIWVIGNDQGYLDMPAKVNKLLIQPGERYDIIIDFAPLAGTNVVLTNTGRTPYPKGPPPQGSTMGRIIQFRVNATPVTDTSYNPALGTPLRTGTETIVRLTNPATGTLAVTPSLTRELTLNEHVTMPVTITVNGVTTKYPGGPTEILVNNTSWDGMRIDPATGVRTPISAYDPYFQADGFGNYLSEIPLEGATEVWEIVNLTADAHPIHTHLAQFQILNRQSFNVRNYMKAYGALFPPSVQIDPATLLPYAGGVPIAGYGPPKGYAPASNPLSGGKYGGNPDVTPYLQGPINPPGAYEAGWKDTLIALPGMVTRFVVRWAPQDVTAGAVGNYAFNPNAGGHGYVWHCHIIDHEDNEMMRPDQVMPAVPESTRTYQIGRDY